VASFSARRPKGVPLVSLLVALIGVSIVFLTILLEGLAKAPALTYADARSATGLQAGPSVTAYPWSEAADPAARDPWGFPQRQCTSYVAWYLNSHGIPFATFTRGPRESAISLPQ
jgi:hypothetical protein